MNCFRSMAVNFCILHTPPTVTLLIFLIPRAVVHPSNLISAISYFFVSSVTRPIEFSLRDPCWSLHSSRIFRVFAALSYFTSSFVSRASVIVTFTINKNLALISLGSSFILDMHTLFHWRIQSFLLNRLKDAPFSTDRNSIVKLSKFAFSAKIRYYCFVLLILVFPLKN